MLKPCYLYKGERLVYEGEGWGIIVDDGQTGPTPDDCREGGSVYATHAACTGNYDKYEVDSELCSYGEFCWNPHESDSAPRCEICNEPVPEGIQGLVYLSKWDR